MRTIEQVVDIVSSILEHGVTADEDLSEQLDSIDLVWIAIHLDLDLETYTKEGWSTCRKLLIACSTQS